MQGSAGFGLSVDVYTCLDQQSTGRSEGRDSEQKQRKNDCRGDRVGHRCVKQAAAV